MPLNFVSFKNQKRCRHAQNTQKSFSLHSFQKNINLKRGLIITREFWKENNVPNQRKKELPTLALFKSPCRNHHGLSFDINLKTTIHSMNIKTTKKRRQIYKLHYLLKTCLIRKLQESCYSMQQLPDKSSHHPQSHEESQACPDTREAKNCWSV